MGQMPFLHPGGHGHRDALTQAGTGHMHYAGWWEFEETTSVTPWWAGKRARAGRLRSPGTSCRQYEGLKISCQGHPERPTLDTAELAKAREPQPTQTDTESCPVAWGPPSGVSLPCMEQLPPPSWAHLGAAQLQPGCSQGAARCTIDNDLVSLQDSPCRRAKSRLDLELWGLAVCALGHWGGRKSLQPWPQGWEG